MFYDMSCGLPCVATANSRSYLSEDGDLYISGARGVSCININEKQTADEAIKLSVPFVDVDGELMPLRDGEVLRIPADCMRLTIHAYAFTYSLQNPRLNYYLEGFDKEPASVSRQELQPVSYTNLGGGKYIFHFSVIDTMTGREVNTISVTLIKEKRIYENGLFWILLVLAAALLISVIAVVYTRNKTGKLVKKQKENRIFINQMIQAFATCIDLKDKYTKGHSFRVARYAAMLAEKMGYDKNEVSNIYDIALLHDIGKIFIPDSILTKPDKLTEEEFEIMKRHTQLGGEIVLSLIGKRQREMAYNIVVYHHEKWNGKGYPMGLSGEETHLCARIVAIADVFDAISADRCYRKAMPLEECFDIIERGIGSDFDPIAAEAFLEAREEAERVHTEFSDKEVQNASD